MIKEEQELIALFLKTDQGKEKLKKFILPPVHTFFRSLIESKIELEELECWEDGPTISEIKEKAFKEVKKTIEDINNGVFLE